MTVAELLTSQRRWGRTRARKFLSALASTRTSGSAPSPRASAPLLSAELAAQRAPRERSVAA